MEKLVLIRELKDDKIVKMFIEKDDEYLKEWIEKCKSTEGSIIEKVDIDNDTVCINIKKVLDTKGRVNINIYTYPSVKDYYNRWKVRIFKTTKFKKEDGSYDLDKQKDYLLDKVKKEYKKILLF